MKISNQDAGVGVAFVHVAFEALEDNRFQVGGDVGIQIARAHKIDGAIKLTAEDVLRLLAREGLPAGQNFVGGGTECKHVGTVIERLTKELLRRHVMGSAGILGRLLGEVRLGLRKIEIDEFYDTISRDENVLGLEVEVHVAHVVDVLQTERHVQYDVAQILREDIVTAGGEEFEIRPLDILHQQVVQPTNLPVFEIADEIFVMMNLGEDFATTDEASLCEEIKLEIVVESSK